MKNLKLLISMLVLAAILPFSAAMAQTTGGGKPPPTVGDPLTPEQGEMMQEGIDAMPCFLCPLVQKGDNKDVSQFVNIHPCNSKADHAIYFDANGKDDNGRTALYLAAHRGNADIIRTLFVLPCLGVDVNLTSTKNNRTALHIAAKRGHLDAVNELLNHAPNLEIRTINGRTALIAALEKRRYAIAQELRDEGAIFPKPEATLKYALENENGELIDAALAALTPDFPYNNYPAVIFKAVLTDNVDLVRALMEDGANCGGIFYEGRTALNHAKIAGNTGVEEFLRLARCFDYVEHPVCIEQNARHMGDHCEPCNDDVLSNNVCVPPIDCRNDQEQAEDGIGCVCKQGTYATGMGYCAKICMSCQAYNRTTERCECPSDMLMTPDNKCIYGPICGNGMVVSDDMRRCIWEPCPAGYPTDNGNGSCFSDETVCTVRKHKHKWWKSSHSHYGTQRMVYSIVAGTSVLTNCAMQ